MPTLEEVLRQKRLELQALQKEVEALELAERIMARAEAGRPDARPSGKKVSQPLMAKAVLEANHREMHVKEISEGIKAKFGVEITPGYLAPVMYRQIGSVFYKSKKAPNTFGLQEWQNKPPLPAPFNNPNMEVTKMPDGSFIARHALTGS